MKRLLMDTKYLTNLEGVLGGAGPIASADFMRSLYVYSCSVEQSMPAVVLLSDPRLSDRTECLLKGKVEDLLDDLVKGLNSLCQLNVTKITIVCVTLHAIVPMLPIELRSKIISLIDLVLDEVIARDGKYLLLSTSGTRSAKIFEKNKLWIKAKEKICFLDDMDQLMVHEAINKLKLGSRSTKKTLMDKIEVLLQKYKADGWVAGCTELHLISKELYSKKSDAKGGLKNCIDPLFLSIEGIHNRNRMQIVGKENAM